MILWAHMNQPPNGIPIGSSVFAQLTRVPITHTDHTTTLDAEKVPSNSCRNFVSRFSTVFLLQTRR